jgi:hypothetical protein
MYEFFWETPLNRLKIHPASMISEPQNQASQYPPLAENLVSFRKQWYGSAARDPGLETP